LNRWAKRRLIIEIARRSNLSALLFVVHDFDLMTLLSFHHVTLHRATVEDKASSLKVFVFVPKMPKINCFVFGPKKAQTPCAAAWLVAKVA